MIKTIIFDLGGVCFNINWKKIDEEMKEKFGISSLVRTYGRDIQELYEDASVGKKTMKEVFEKICEGKDLNVDEVVNYYKELYKKYKNLNEEIFILIKNLKDKIRVVCLTDTNEVHFQAHEEQNHLSCFDECFASFQLGINKLNKDIFKIIIDKLNLKPEEIIFVDDSQEKVDNAKSFGINGIKFENIEQLKIELNKFGV